ncbi:hypothetical protein DSM112329_01197 [Paraconexibacter sp. AEG42_29]|uniref:Uncharacterized protein n=1 Tax=Paraconexibacter sp. AEG42_29 TaxID=2997339 RepID=A0AAU7ARN4_9ACTN
MNDQQEHYPLEAYDYMRRVMSVLLAIVGVFLFAAGTKLFAGVVTKTFSSAGFAIVPLGMFITGIFLIPLMSAVHGFWTDADPAMRARTKARDDRDAAKVRLSAAEYKTRAQREAEGRAAREAADSTSRGTTRSTSSEAPG